MTARLAPIALAAIALVGCGSATFTAEELVAEVNRNGGEIQLGEPLPVQAEDVEIYSLILTGGAETPEDVHAAGTLLITGSDDAALTEYRRCESAASLICFRAANALLAFEGAVPESDLARLGRAIRAMATR